MTAMLLLLIGGTAYWAYERYFAARPIAAVPFVSPYSEYSAEDRREGLHCLEEDGSHAEVVERVKAELPHPETFEHRGTAMFPVRNGKHFLVMSYRSRSEDGYRMDAGVALTKIDHARCFAGEIERIS
jgi:hypothetical protein